MDTIQIFGCSSRINDIRESVNSFLLKYPSLGINRFPESFPNVDYWLFVDSSMADRIVNGGIYNDQKIITCNHIYDHWFKGRPEFKVHTVFEPNDLELKIGNSAYYGLEWAIKQGYKKAILYGVLDEKHYKSSTKGIEFKHFYGGNGYFPVHKFQDLKNAIDSGLDGRIEIERAL